MKGRLINIAGNIGTGKSTLVEKLAEALNYIPLHEPVQDNPYLEDYYSDSKRWAFEIQVFFLSQRYQQYFQNEDKNRVQDRTIEEDIKVFAPAQLIMGNFDQRAFDTYSELFKAMELNLGIRHIPDLLIYLYFTDTEKLLERIQGERCRDCENLLPLDYLVCLNNLYEKWINNWNNFIPVIKINTQITNYKDDEVIFNKVLNKIKTLL